MKIRTKWSPSHKHKHVVTLTTRQFSFHQQDLGITVGRDERVSNTCRNGFTLPARETPRGADIPLPTNTSGHTTQLLQDGPPVPLQHSLKGRSEKLYPRLDKYLSTKPKPPVHFLRQLCITFTPQASRWPLNTTILPLHSLLCYYDSC